MRRTALALACTLLAPCAATAGDGMQQAWKAYAQRMMSPGFAWAAPVDAAPPTVLDAQRARLADADSLVMVSLASIGSLQIDVGDGRFGFGFEQGAADQLQQAFATFGSSFAATTLTRALDSDSALSLSAIVAEQRFATPGFGSSVWIDPQPRIGIMRHGSHEIANGSGVRLAFDRRLDDAFGWTVMLQSRLEMDAFKTYRGVYSEAGDFDIPGFVQTGLRWSPSSRIELSADVQRVFYSEVDTFTSASLPTAFLSLLGDGSSPEFAWRDLTVMSVEAATLSRNGARWSLRYSTQQQPRPSSDILDLVLSEQYSDTNLALGFEQPLGAFGRISLAASYSSAGYFLGTSPFVQHDFDAGSQLEFEAQWALRF